MNIFKLETEEGYSIFNGISVVNKHLISYYNFNFLTSLATVALKRDQNDKKLAYNQSITGLYVDKDLNKIPLDDSNVASLYKLYNAITFNLDEISLTLAESILSKSAKASIYIDYILKLHTMASSDDISSYSYASIIAKINLLKQLFEQNKISCSLETLDSYTGILAPASVTYTYKPSIGYGTLQGTILYES